MVVEDDQKLRERLAHFFRQSGHEIVESGNGGTAVQQAINEDFDAIILDMMLPEISGLQFLSILRKSKNTPVIMISTIPELDYRLTAFQSGADDFLVKPLNLQEVLERIQAILRRTKPDNTQIFRIRNVEIDLLAKRVSLDGNLVHMSPKEFDILGILAKNHGRIISRKMLEDMVLEGDPQEYSNIIDQYIMKIRRKLGKDFITTKIGLGFVIYA